MNIKHQLSLARNIEREIQELNYALREAEEKMIYRSPTFNETVQGGSINCAEDKMMRLAEYADNIRLKKIELEKAKNEIFNLIYKIPQEYSEERGILIAFYLNCKKANDIADERYEDVSGIYKKINKAVNVLKRYI